MYLQSMFTTTFRFAASASLHTSSFVGLDMTGDLPLGTASPGWFYWFVCILLDSSVFSPLIDLLLA